MRPKVFLGGPSLSRRHLLSRMNKPYNTLKGKMDLNNLVGSTIQIAKEIEQIANLKGKEKLELLQSILRICIHDSDKSPEEKEALYFTVDRVVPVIIEAAILASKSPIVRQVQAVCCGCWTKTVRS